MTQLSYRHNNLGSLQMEGSIMRLSRAPSPVKHPRQRQLQDHEIDIFALPPDAETLQLIEQYFLDTGTLFPYLHRETFLQTYAQAKWNNFKTIRRTWLGLLNMVLALVTSTTVRRDIDAGRRSELSDIYYHRAAGLCEKQIMRGTSLEIGKACHCPAYRRNNGFQCNSFS